MTKSPTVFIVSSGRSGTTLLVSMLNTSGQIYFPYESDFIARSFSLYSKKISFNTEDYKNLTELFFLCSQPQGWGMEQKEVLDYLHQYTPNSLGEVFSIFCLAFHEAHNTRNLLWGIKCPVLIANLNEINFLYPEARIIHIIRDGRDVYLSYKKIHRQSRIKFGPKGLVQSALYWIDGLRKVESFRHTDKLLEIKYESLLKKPDVELKRISQFLSIEYTSDMHENFNQYSKNEFLTPSYLKFDVHSNLENQLDANNVEKFRHQMSKFEQFIFELVSAPYLKKYGYHNAYSWFQSVIFKPAQYILYFLAQLFNDWRYTKRDKERVQQALQLTRPYKS